VTGALAAAPATMVAAPAPRTGRCAVSSRRCARNQWDEEPLRARAMFFHKDVFLATVPRAQRSSHRDGRALAATGVFCLLAGARLHDQRPRRRRGRRLHPIKRNRPHRSGLVPEGMAAPSRSRSHRSLRRRLRFRSGARAGRGPLLREKPRLHLQAQKVASSTSVDCLRVRAARARGKALPLPYTSSGYMLACTALLALYPASASAGRRSPSRTPASSARRSRRTRPFARRGPRGDRHGHGSDVRRYTLDPADVRIFQLELLVG